MKRNTTLLTAAISLVIAAGANAQTNDDERERQHEERAVSSSQTQQQPTERHRHGQTAGEAARDHTGTAGAHGEAVSEVARTQQMFKQLDDDNDGNIAQADLPQQSSLADNFDRWDTNEDERLSHTEFDMWARAQSAGELANFRAMLGVDDEVAVTIDEAIDVDRTAATAAATGTTTTRADATATTTVQIEAFRQVFRQLDTSNNGFVLRRDLPCESTLRSNFAQFDLNSDRRLSMTEFEAWARAQGRAELTLLRNEAAELGTLGATVTTDTTVAGTTTTDTTARNETTLGAAAQTGVATTDAATRLVDSRPQEAIRGFDELDRDKAGFLSRDDVAGTAIATHFDHYDQDGDDRLSRIEYQAWITMRDADRDVAVDEVDMDVDRIAQDDLDFDRDE